MKAKEKPPLAKVLYASFTDVLKAPVSRWATIGASLRYFGQFASDYYIPLFYMSTYPTMKKEFALCYSLINMCCGFMSSLGGGIIADKFGKGRPMMKSYICTGGSLLALPFFVSSVLITNNFWLSIGCTAMRFLLGEPFRSPSVTMIQNSTKPEKFGNLVGAYQFYQKMTLVLSALVIKAIFDKFGVAGNAVKLGKTLAFVGSIAYIGAGGAYYIAGKHYVAFRKKIKFRSMFAKNRKGRGYDK